MSQQEPNSHIYDECTRTWKNTYRSFLVLLPWYLIVWHVQRSMKDFSVDGSSIRFWFFADNFSFKGLLIIWEINRLIHIIQIPILLLTDHKTLTLGSGSWFRCHVLKYQLCYKKTLFVWSIQPQPKGLFSKGKHCPCLGWVLERKFPYVYLISRIYSVSNNVK